MIYWHRFSWSHPPNRTLYKMLSEYLPEKAKYWKLIPNCFWHKWCQIEFSPIFNYGQILLNEFVCLIRKHDWSDWTCSPPSARWCQRCGKIEEERGAFQK